MTMWMIDISTDIRPSDVGGKPVGNAPKHFLRQHAIWLFSLLIHTIILMLVSLNRPPSASMVAPIVPTLAAHLYQPRLVRPKATPPASSIAPDLPTHAPSAAKSTKDTTSVTKTASTISAPVTTPAESPDTPPTTSLAVPTHPVPPKPADTTGKQALRRFMAQHNATALQDLAGQQAGDYQHNKTSPRLIETRTLNEIQAPATPRTTKVRCDNTLSTALATLSGIAGGTLVCSQRKTNHDEFIQRQRNPELRD
ncbi:hypothetical protein [Salinimonas lutimaris]|uniref:hypothetical protein n=1 Tax=Salinimonas lutimaris TaxID=914153 RepID=UPI0010C02B12|nr:hypothetical protein [Salinimonas lutimaris]